MKRVISMALLVLFSIVLSGCEFLENDAIRELSEDLCRENPDHELCDLDKREDLENDAIAEIVTEAFMKAKEKANKTKCSNHIAITNTELLDDCNSDNPSFIPEGVDEITVIDVMKDGEMYNLTVKTNLDSFFDITVSFVEIDGALFIETLETGELYLVDDLDPAVRSRDVLKTYFETYLEAPDKDAFCRDAVPDGVDQDCDGIALVLGHSILATVQEVKMLDNGLYMIVFALGEDGSRMKEAYVNAVEDDMDNIIIDEFTTLAPNDGEDVDDFLKRAFVFGLFDAYKNARDIDEYCTIWYDGVDDDCNRVADTIGMSMVYTVSEVVLLDENLVEVTLTYDAASGLATGKRYAWVDVTDDGEEVLRDVGTSLPEDEVTLEEMTRFLHKMVYDFNDDTMTNDEFAMMYFNEVFRQDFGPVMGSRNSDMPLELRLGMVYEFEGDVFTVQLIGVMDDKMIYETIVIKPIRLELSVRYIDHLDPDDDGDSIDTDETEAFFKDFINDYLDATVTDEMINLKYFLGTMDMEFFAARREMLSDGTTIEFVSITARADSFFDITIDISSMGENTREKIKVKVKRLDKSSPLLMIIDDDDDNDVILTELEYMEDFAMMLNDTTLGQDDVCLGFLDEDKWICEALYKVVRDNDLLCGVTDHFLTDDGTGLVVVLDLKRGDTLYDQVQLRVSDIGDNPLYKGVDVWKDNPIFEAND